MNRSAPHSQLLKTIREYIQTIGGYEVNVLGGIGARVGVPDLLCAVPVRRYGPARFVAIEAKTGTGVLSAKQRLERDKVIAARALHIEAHSLEDIEHALLSAGIIERPFIAHVRCADCLALNWGRDMLPLKAEAL